MRWGCAFCTVAAFSEWKPLLASGAKNGQTHGSNRQHEQEQGGPHGITDLHVDVQDWSSLLTQAGFRRRFSKSSYQYSPRCAATLYSHVYLDFMDCPTVAEL